MITLDKVLFPFHSAESIARGDVYTNVSVQIRNALNNISETLHMLSSLVTHSTAHSMYSNEVTEQCLTAVSDDGQVKVCLRQPGQPQTPPLRPLTDVEVVLHLWTGERAIAKQLLISALPELSAGPMLDALAAARNEDEQSTALAITEGENPDMVQLVALINRPTSGAQVRCIESFLCKLLDAGYQLGEQVRYLVLASAGVQCFLEF